ncbi:MAG: class I SAM-dependent methyltransferase [candidate division Zixibacteria bacterium]|nr:class I SAM-dependent methyltransferase [candidate division Zixibacteria bacterium]
MRHDKHDPHIETKNRFLHGAMYHMLWDRPLAETRRKVIDSIPRCSSVLDIGCGTGQFCFELAEQKDCHILGIDLSPRMITFAGKRNRYNTVRFESGDAADLARFETSCFDYATIILLLHEIPRSIQLAAVTEASRVARKTIIVDMPAPLPMNIHGIALRIVEKIGGSRHYRSFMDYQATGGISGILNDSSLQATIAHHAVFWYGCREMVVLESTA